MENINIDAKKFQDTVIGRLNKIEKACLFKIDEQDNLVPIGKSCFVTVGKKDKDGHVGVQAYGSDNCYKEVNDALTETPFPLDK